HRVELHCLGVRTGDQLPSGRVDQVEQTALTGQRLCLDGCRGDRVALDVQHHHLLAGRDVGTSLDDAVIAERDTNASVRTDEATLADTDALGAASRKGASNRAATTQVRVGTNDDAVGDATFDHRLAECAGGGVDEALV